MKKPPGDEVTYGPMIGPDRQVGRRRLADGTMQTVILHPPQEGVPLNPGEEIVEIDQTQAVERDGELWFPSTTTFKNGPPQVATPRYCAGWDRIFKKKQEVGRA